MAELKPKMKKAVELMVANPEMEYAEVAKEIGIDRVTDDEYKRGRVLYE